MTPAMVLASSVCALVALVWSAVLAWLAIGALIRRRQLQRRFSAQPVRSQVGRSVLLVRPCAGVDPGLLDNLLSFAELRTQADLSLVMTVDDPGDPALPIVEQAAAQLCERGLDASVEVHPPTGPNRKASLLAGVLGGERGRAAQLWVNVDSNVDLAGYELDALLGALKSDSGPGRLGAVWAPWSELREGEGLGARASEAVLGGALTALPLLCGIYPGGFTGKVWAARPEAVADAGGLARLVDYLGEDFEMSSRLRAAGWGTEVAPVFVHSRGGSPSLDSVIERFSRWMLVVRTQRAALMPSYLLLFFATPLVLVLAGLGAYGRPTLALVAVGLAVFARALITLGARHWSRRRGFLGAWIDAPLSDLVLLLAWVRAMGSREVEWRGHRLRVGRDGRLLPMLSEASAAAGNENENDNES